MFGYKGKGKSKGKGGDAGGHLKPRTRLSAEKFSGTVNAWKGKFGFITPGEPIEHPKASLHNGGLFASVDDIQGASELIPGATVMFHIWEDESGLGAEEIVMTGPPPAGFKGSDQGKGKGKTTGKSWGKGSSGFDKGGWDKGGWDKGGSKGWGKVQPTISKPWEDWSKGGKGWDMGKGKAKGKYSPEGGKGHTLEKTRLSAEKFTGTVSAWKGKYGWIKPAEAIDHPLASKHQGDLFAGMDDIQGGMLRIGAQVEFHIFEDSSGLGAEEVIQY